MNTVAGNRIIGSPVWILALVLLSGVGGRATAAFQEQAYQTIAKNNAFHLKMPEPQSPKAMPPPPNPPKVVLTGVTDLLGKKRVLLEILEAGRPLYKPILAQGEALETIEVLQIDVPLGRVKLRIAGVESILSFQSPKSISGASISATSLPPLPGSPP